MSLHRRWYLTICCLFFSSLATLAQESAEGIIRQAIQTMGIPNDKKPYYQTWREQGTLSMQGINLPYDAQWTFEPTDKYRFDMKAEMQGQKMEIQFIQSGEKARESAMGQTRMVEGEKLVETTHSAYQLYVNTLTPLLNDPSFKLKLSGEKEFAGKSVVGVVVSKEGKRDVTLYFDKKTHLLAGTSDRVKDEFQGWKEVPQEVEFADYEKSPSGEMVFRTMTIKRDGQVLIKSKMSENKRHEGKAKPDLFKLN